MNNEEISDLYYTIPISSAEYRFVEKASKFLTLCAPVKDEETAADILTERSKLYYDASHHCWAFRVGDPFDPIERYSDAGEPSGTAGRPILDQIRKADLIGVIVIVTRWFGGTKLGKGGLVRAYGNGAAGAITEVKTKVLRPMTCVSVKCSYDLIGLTEKISAQFEGKITQGDYSDSVILKVELPTFHQKPFIHTLIDSSSGRIEAEVV